MNIHKNARLTPYSRAEAARRVLQEGQSAKSVATDLAVSERTVRNWAKRSKEEGPAGLQDRSSRPAPALPADAGACGSADRRTAPGANDRQGNRSRGRCIVGNGEPVLKRLGLNKLKALELAEPVRRYEREHPGELIHIDIKKLGKFNKIGHRITGDRTGQSNSRGVGWEFVHVCIDDASRIAFSQVMKDERKTSAVAFLKAAIAYYKSWASPCSAS